MFKDLPTNIKLIIYEEKQVCIEVINNLPEFMYTYREIKG